MSKQLYINIAELILRDLLINQTNPGSKLKSVREFALEYKVNAKTVQRAFDYLETFNLFYSIVGEGRFLINDPAVLAKIKYILIDAEAEEFVSKMKKYNLSLEDAQKIIKENYERDN